MCTLMVAMAMVAIVIVIMTIVGVMCNRQTPKKLHNNYISIIFVATPICFHR